MKNELRIKIKFDKDTKELVVVENDLKRFAKTIDVSASKTKAFTESLIAIGASAGGIYGVAKAFDAIVQNGLRYNASIETMKIGIASLISVNTEAKSGVNKFAEAMKMSSDVMAMLKKANLETSATLTQLTEGFQSTLGPALKAGMTIKQTVEYTKLMTQAAGAMGVPMNQLAQEMRSVVSGTIDMNSVVAKNIGITNEQIKTHKKQGDLFEFLKRKLGDFADAGKAVSDSWDGSISNMQDAWDNLTGTITESTFESLKPTFHKITEWINDLTESFENASAAAKSIFEVKEDQEIIAKYNDLVEKLNEVQDKLKNGVSIWGSMFGTGNTKAELEQQKKFLEQQIRLLGQHANASKLASEQSSIVIKTHDNAPPGDTTNISGFVSAYDKYSAMMLDKESLFYKKLGDQIASLSELDAEQQMKYYEAAMKKREEKQLKSLYESQDKQLKLTKQFYEESGQISKAWLIEEHEIREKYAGFDQAAVEKIVENHRKAYFEKMVPDAEKTANAIYEAFKGMERHLKDTFESFFDYTSDKFLRFGDLVENVLHEIYMQMMRTTIINPLVGGLTGMLPFARGGVVQAFSSGGIVSQPTVFPMANGMGLMGEAGAEAIMPLTRINGDLGVKAIPSNVIINVKNETGLPIDMEKIGQMRGDNGQQIIDVVVRHAQTDPEFRQIMGIQ
ncbi:phage tail tape measure protein [Hydrogenimonas urashimensis]|uniref:phage tail tape measure protein n=1 Tax=Hydrogenimonas urashimensis TaxID=2740515 RepID=UPI001914FE3E|nr:phage tail tape measure protein [Hydrogenimonas urashimensis]